MALPPTSGRPGTRGPTVSGNPATPSSARPSSLSRTRPAAPASKATKQKKSSLRKYAVIAFASAAAGFGFYAFNHVMVSKPHSVAFTDPGASSSAKDVATYLDNNLRITRDGQNITRAPLYDKLEALARDLGTGQQASFDTLYDEMQILWVGKGKGTGVIGVANPGGTLSTMPDHLRTATLTKIDAAVRTFITDLKGQHDFAGRIAGHPEAAKFIQEWPAQSAAIQTMLGKPAVAASGNAGVIAADSVAKPMADLFPGASGDIPLSYKLLRDVVGKIDTLRPDFILKASVESMGQRMANGITPANARDTACSIAGEWYNNDVLMRQSPAFAQALQLVQTENPTLPVSDYLDRARNAVIKVGSDISRSRCLPNMTP